MKKFNAIALLGGAMLAFPAAAHAQNAGTVQVKVLATGILPDGKIDSLISTTLALPAGTQAQAKDNWVPTIAAEYFLSPNLSIETICCMTQHDVMGDGGLPESAELIANAKIVPATFTLKAHANVGGIKPYVGVGPSMFLFINEKPGATMSTLGATKVDLSNKIGAAFQIGADVPVTDAVFLTLDAKKYIMRPTATWTNVSGATILETRHKLDPLVVSIGLGMKF